MHRTHNLHKRLILFILFFGVQIGLLFYFWTHLDFLNNFKFAYLSTIYLPVIQYRIDQKKTTLETRFRQPTNVLSLQTEPAVAIPALLYHSIIETPDGTNVTLSNFTSQMMVLKKAGYQTISIQDFFSFSRGERELPEKSILITFDDGPKTSYYPVDPLLKALDFTAVSFMITRYSIGEGSPYYLSSREIKRMIQSRRWEPQLHTKNGHDLYKISENGTTGRFYPNKLWRFEDNRLETNAEYLERIRTELREGKEDFAKAYGMETISFAFPFGDFAQNTTNYPEAKNILLNEVQQAFPMAFYQIYRGGGYTFNYPNESPFMRKRIIVQPEWNGEDLLQALDFGTPKQLPYGDSFSINRGWTNTWGKQTFTARGLLLETDQSDGGSVFLDGAYHWKNYHLVVDAIWNSGSSFSVLSRYRNNDTFLACVVNDEGVSVVISEDGKERMLAKKVLYTPLQKDDRIHVEVVVNQDEIHCQKGDRLTVSVVLPESSATSGGIGFKNWGDTMDASTVYVTNVTVKPLP